MQHSDSHMCNNAAGSGRMQQWGSTRLSCGTPSTRASTTEAMCRAISCATRPGHLNMTAHAPTNTRTRRGDFKSGGVARTTSAGTAGSAIISAAAIHNRNSTCNMPTHTYHRQSVHGVDIQKRRDGRRLRTTSAGAMGWAIPCQTCR